MERSVRVRKALIVFVWALAIGVSTAGWLLALAYIGYLAIMRAVSQLTSATSLITVQATIPHKAQLICIASAMRSPRLRNAHMDGPDSD
jgi:hypothetical protein